MNVRGGPDRVLIAGLGASADITIFDPITVTDCATFENPHQFAKGIFHVIVNGVLAVQDGNLTGAAAGKVLKKC